MHVFSSAIIMGFAAMASVNVNGQSGVEYEKDASGVLSFNASDSVIAVNQDAVRAPQGFIFDCDAISCPSGSYQDLCPQCDDLQYGGGVNVLQCSCFDSSKQLQAVSTVQDAQNCNSISASDSGALVCGSGNASLRGKKHHKHQNSEKADGVDITAAPTQEGATVAPTPQFIATASPTIGSGPVMVDFVFNCAAGNCPNGEYQQFCPRCEVNTDSTTPGNDPQDSISCLCFNYNGQMLLRTSTMWGFEKCPKITVDFGGILQCPGAKRNSGITVYGGR